jgi:hypothetical protein
MIVSGFSFIRNARKLDYPIVEALSSILPLCDEVVVAVGEGDDDTRSVVFDLDEKVRVIDTKWDDSLREGGQVLAVETNKALHHVNPQSTWLIYIQGDECLHEKDYALLKEAMAFYRDRQEVEGFLFQYRHFYGSYDFIGDSRKWYRKEIRIIRNLPGMTSYKDAQGFRFNGRKLNVIELDAHVHHYGWVRHPKYQMAKQVAAHQLWHDDEYIKETFDADEDFDYSQIDSLSRFNGTHPQVMQGRINKMNWEFNHDPSKKELKGKNRWLYWVEKWLGWRIGEYRNYRVVGRFEPKKPR